MPIDPLKKLATPDRTVRPKIVVNGVPLLPDHKSTVQEVTVQMELDTPTMWTVRLAIGNAANMLTGLNVFDFLPRYKPGALTNILFTTESIPVPMVTGPLTAIEPEHDGDRPAVEIRGFDFMYRLRHGVTSCTFPKTTDSGLATQVAASVQVPLFPEPTSYLYDAVQQYNQSNLEFLLRRAERIGFELVSVVTGVLFRKPPRVGLPVATIKEGRELMEFRPKMKMLTEGETAQVYSFDQRLGKPIITSAIPISVGAGLDPLAFTGAAAAMPLSPTQVVEESVEDDAEAQILAQAAQDKAKRGFITASGRTIGDAKIRPGQFMFIQNVGMFAGLYYITAATHTINEEGYYTDFEVRRDTL